MLVSNEAIWKFPILISFYRTQIIQLQLMNVKKLQCAQEMKPSRKTFFRKHIHPRGPHCTDRMLLNLRLWQQRPFYDLMISCVSEIIDILYSHMLLYKQSFELWSQRVDLVNELENISLIKLFWMCLALSLQMEICTPGHRWTSWERTPPFFAHLCIATINIIFVPKLTRTTG